MCGGSMLKLFTASLLLLWPALASAQTAPVSIVAAENFYADVIEQIAPPGAKIVGVMSNPNQDPHLFEADPATARAVANASLVVYSGLDYDPWMQMLLSSTRPLHRRVIAVADLLHLPPGGNPHIWYDPLTMPAFAKAIAAALGPDNDARLAKFLASMQPIQDKVAAMRAKFAGLPVTATEPVFGPMAAAIGLTMRNEHFQLAVMNDTEPSAADTAAFERDLKTRRVRVLIYNSQATDSAAMRLRNIARSAKIPVIGVTETEPAGTTYQGWMLGQLNRLEIVLNQPAS
jgi:zinc/manganese transport system substrate-binding protein